MNQVLYNNNLLGNILSFLTPLEILSSIPHVSKVFYHTSKTSWAIERLFSSMLPEIFWIRPPLDYPCIITFKGLFNKIYKGARLLFYFRICKICGRLLILDSYPYENGSITQVHKRSYTRHRRFQRVSLHAYRANFTLYIGDEEKHTCKNFCQEESTNGINCEWYLKFLENKIQKKEFFNLKRFVEDYKISETNYNNSLICGLGVGIKSFMQMITVGGNCLMFHSNFNFKNNSRIVLEKCIEFGGNYREAYMFKSAKEKCLILIELMKFLISSKVIYSACIGNGSNRILVDGEGVKLTKFSDFYQKKYNVVLFDTEDIN
ncbi:unnamed protein product [Blepharisma stoltei]|uniref:F-box domain-containing protein n=1 Tax=Blepharisma stoltei TaxID=1481888 RepID=A0AAU9JPK7_9CILI|nr:unnamed protein product [Blepharisma stoltei]